MTLSLLLLPPQGRAPHTLALLQRGLPPWEEVLLHKLLQPEPFPWAAVLIAPEWVLCGVTALAANLL